MKLSKKFLPLIFILAASLLLSACSGRRFVPEGWPGITVDGDTAYVAYRDHVYFIDQNGVEFDRFPEEKENGQTFFAAPVLTENGDLLVGSYAGSFYNISATTAQQNGETWELAQSRFVGSPLLLNNTIYLPSAEYHLYALDAKLNPIEGFNFEIDHPLWAPPVTDGKLLYITAQDHFLYALNPSNGAIVWQQDMGGTMVSSPVLDDNGILYVGTFSSEVIAFDTATQSEKWRFNTEDWVWATPTLADGILYITDLSGIVYAIDANEGSQKWRYDSGSSIPGGVLVHEEQIYFGNESGTVYALDIKGVLKWNHGLSKEDAEVSAFGTPVVFGDTIIFGIVNDGLILAAFDSNGATQWDFTPEEK